MLWPRMSSCSHRYQQAGTVVNSGLLNATDGRNPFGLLAADAILPFQLNIPSPNPGKISGVASGNPRLTHQRT